MSHTTTSNLLTFPEFAQGKVDPQEAGKQGGNTSGSGNDALEDTSSGDSGKGSMFCLSCSLHCANSAAEFAGGKVDPVEAGKKGGQS